MSGVVDGIKGVINGIVGVFKSVWNQVADMWNSTIGGVGFSVPSWVPGFGGDGFHMPDLPHLAGGGVVVESGLVAMNERGAEVVALPAGAAVYPHGSGPAAPSKTVTVNNVFHGITDVRKLAAEAASATGWALRAS